MLKVGKAAFVGLPNAGKSTLLNTLVGTKIAATTHKPQTTQKNLKGIYTDLEAQIILMDTPGILTPTLISHRHMQQQAVDALKEVDVVVLLVDIIDAVKGFRSIQKETLVKEVLEQIQELQKPLILLITKVDTLKNKSELLSALQKWSEQPTIEAIIPFSSYEKIGVVDLLKNIKKHLNIGEKLFDQDQTTTATEKDIAAEFIREKAILELKDELPYQVKVEIEAFDESRREDPKKPIVSIDAVLWVEKESQKAIVLGKRGDQIKAISQRARKDIEYLLNCQVMLSVFVKVRK